MLDKLLGCSSKTRPSSKSRTGSGSLQQKSSKAAGAASLAAGSKTLPETLEDANSIRNPGKAAVLSVDPAANRKLDRDDPQPSLEKKSASLGRAEAAEERPHLKRKFEAQNARNGPEASASKTAPSVPARLLAERLNGLGRAESGELPQEPLIATQSSAGRYLVIYSCRNEMLGKVCL